MPRLEPAPSGMYGSTTHHAFSENVTKLLDTRLRSRCVCSAVTPVVAYRPVMCMAICYTNSEMLSTSTFEGYRLGRKEWLICLMYKWALVWFFLRR